jgi:hypothetical protein
MTGQEIGVQEAGEMTKFLGLGPDFQTASELWKVTQPDTGTGAATTPFEDLVRQAKKQAGVLSKEASIRNTQIELGGQINESMQQLRTAQLEFANGVYKTIKPAIDTFAKTVNDANGSFLDLIGVIAKGLGEQLGFTPALTGKP